MAAREVARCPRCGAAVADGLQRCPACRADLRAEILFLEPDEATVPASRLRREPTRRGRAGAAAGLVVLAVLALVTSFGPDPPPAEEVAEDTAPPTSASPATTRPSPPLPPAPVLDWLPVLDPSLAGQHLVLWSADRQLLVTVDLGTGVPEVTRLPDRHVRALLAVAGGAVILSERGATEIDADGPIPLRVPAAAPVTMRGSTRLFWVVSIGASRMLVERTDDGVLAGGAVEITRGLRIVGAIPDGIVASGSSGGVFVIDRASGQAGRVADGEPLDVAGNEVLVRQCPTAERCDLVVVDVGGRRGPRVMAAGVPPTTEGRLSQGARSLLVWDGGAGPRRSVTITGRAAGGLPLRTVVDDPSQAAFSADGSWVFFLSGRELHAARVGAAIQHVDVGLGLRFDLLDVGVSGAG